MRTLPLLAAFLFACSSLAPDKEPAGKADDPNATLPAVVPKRIIWMIGDGMGVAQISAAAYANGEPLALLSMPNLAFMSTHEHEFATTDSAAAATAMASGEKTHFESVGVLAGTTKDDEGDADNHLDTIIDVAQEAGWRTGLVATTSLVDATPAAFAAHRAKRKSKTDIARDLARAEVDVMLGGGLSFFEGRSDGLNLLNRLRDRGYSVTKTKTGLSRVANRATRAIGLFADKDMPEVTSGERLVDLATMTEKAIKMLDRDNDDGFFLMVEGSWIDRESHVVNGKGTIAETLDFDAAVTAALAYARGRDDTLVIVTADHETGGLAVLDPGAATARVSAIGGTAEVERLTSFRSASAAPAFETTQRGAGKLTPAGTAGSDLVTTYGFLSVASRASFTGPSFLFRATHSNTNVAVFAEGPGSEFVTEIRDNADLGHRVHMLARADGESDTDPTDPPPITVPDNLIVVVADDLGLSSLTAAQYATGDTTIAQMRRRGLVAVHAEDSLVNDAGGSATTLSTGTLARRGDVGKAGLASLLARAEASGHRTAIVTTADVTSGGIAGFYSDGANAPAAALVDFEAGDGLDLVFAGGRDSFTTTELDRWRARGVDLDMNWSSTTPSSTKQTVRLVADAALPAVGDRSSSDPALADMVRAAVASLELAAEPYVLVVYAGGLAERVGAHDRSKSLIDEVVEIDRAVEEALLAAGRTDNTAVVVTSLGDSSLSVLDNHYGFHKKHCGIAKRCGGDVAFADIPLASDRVVHGGGFEDSELQGDFAPPGIILQYAWISQRAGADADMPESGTAHFVPLFAFGPGARQLEGFHLQTEVAQTLAGWVE